MRRLAITALVVGVLAAPTAAALLYAFVDGKKTSGYTSVVFLDFGDGSECSGTVVGTRMLLTAAHCFRVGASDTAPPKPDVIINGGRRFSAESCFAHPDYTRLPQFDVALCRLPRDAGVRPHPLSSGAATPNTDDVTYVGYGNCSSTRRPDGLARRYGWGKVQNVKDHVLQIDGHAVCGGDSGGPVFMSAPGGHPPVAAVLSAAGFQRDPDAWMITEERTAKWLQTYQSELCFESLASSACDRNSARR